MLWRFSKVYNGNRQFADHHRPVRYELPRPEIHAIKPRDRRELYIHTGSGRRPARHDPAVRLPAEES